MIVRHLPWILGISLVAGLNALSAGVPALTAPKNFTVAPFATGLGKARFMAVRSDGVLFVTAMEDGIIYALPDRNGDGRADGNVVFAKGLERPHGLAFLDGWLYVACEARVVRFRDADGDLQCDGSAEVIVEGLPRDGHVSRTVVFGADRMMYLSIGSSCNVCIEEDPRRAAVVRYTPEGKNETLFARGLRNSVGIVFRPGTGELWGTDNGRDWLGDLLPPEEINRIEEGRHYGWPYAYGQNVHDPKYGRVAPKHLEFTPALHELPAHWAPLGLRFCDSERFPESFRGDLFIACHGSWNSSDKVGYRVVRFEMKDGRPAGMTDFLTGFLGKGKKVLGRPVDVIFGADGACYVSDDYAGAIYRVTPK